jgi:hypothetical protein
MGARPWGRFIDLATEVKIESSGVDRTARGAKWMAPGELSPIVVDYSCGVDDNKSTGNVTFTEVDQPGFLFFNLFRCSTLSGDLDDVREWTDDSFESIKSEALAYAATTAITGSHYNLATHSTQMQNATSVTDVVGFVEMGLADRISNQRGYILMHPRYLANAVAAYVIRQEGDILVSPSGHKVIADAGVRPYNVVYGTGSLGWAIMSGPDDANMRSYLDRTRNIATWFKESYGIVVFNPAWSVKSTITGGYPG